MILPSGRVLARASVFKPSVWRAAVTASLVGTVIWPLLAYPHSWPIRRTSAQKFLGSRTNRLSGVMVWQIILKKSLGVYSQGSANINGFYKR